jgi:hypothetical protein
MKAVGQMAGGIASYDAGRFTKRVMRTNAQNAQNEGVMERDRIRHAARLAMGRQIVGQAGTGFAVGTGSALDELKESKIAEELDLMASRLNASSKAAAFRSEGDLAYMKGYSDMTGGILSGAMTLMEQAAGAFGGGGGGSAGGMGAHSMGGSAAIGGA